MAKKKDVKELEKIKKSASDFKKFISRGNVVDMAVGVIVGGAFGKIVTSLVNDMLMPLIGVLLGGLDFTELSIKVGDASILYGNFIQTIIDFLLNKGVVLMELGKFEEAVDSFNKVLLRNPDNEDAFFLKEECLENFQLFLSGDVDYRYLIYEIQF